MRRLFLVDVAVMHFGRVALGVQHRAQVFDGNGNAGPTAWWNGRVVGGWRQDADARVHLQLLEDIGADGRNALARKADELTDWLGGTRISPRFPSPLSKAATR